MNVGDDPILGDDGYPSEAELDRVRKWKIAVAGDATALLAYVRERWQYADMGYWAVARRRRREWKNGPLYRAYRISTGGWSGNEDLIGAMNDNAMFWLRFWHSSRRGGHYEFRVEGE